MNASITRWVGVAGAAIFVLLASGCDEDCGGCGESTVVVETPCCANVYPYRLNVRVQDTVGYTLGGASVELLVTTVPEQRFIATTQPDGVAVFYFDSPPDVVAIAYACAPGYPCNASEVITAPSSAEFYLDVVLGL